MAGPTRKLPRYAIPALALVALGFVVAGVLIGTGGFPAGDPRNAVPALSRPAAQITASSPAPVAGGAIAAIALGPDATAPTDLGTFPVPAPGPQSVPVPGPSPETPSPTVPPRVPTVPIAPTLPPTVPAVPGSLLQPLFDLTKPLTDPVTQGLAPVVPPPVTTDPQAALTGLLGSI